MFCSACDYNNPPDFSFCSQCGESLPASYDSAIHRSPTIDIRPEAETVVRPAKVKKAHTLVKAAAWSLSASAVLACILVLGVVVVFLLALAFSRNSQVAADSTTFRRSNITNRANASTKADSTSVNDGPPLPDPPAQRLQIVNETFGLNGGQFRYFGFTCHTICELSGGFVARGGANDVDVMIMNTANVAEYNAGRPFMTIYQSGPVSRGKIVRRLEKGDWVIVFSNRRALITAKEVSAEFYAQ